MKESSIEEDIKLLERKIELNKQMYLEFGRLLSLDEETVNAIENLINKNKELEKMVELMAKDIAENDIEEDICRKVKNKTSEKDDCYGDDYDMCKDCVIEFYKKKVRDKE